MRKHTPCTLTTTLFESEVLPKPHDPCDSRKHFKATDLAWAAGYIDGEGCICVHTWIDKRSKRLTHMLKLIIVSCEPETLERLQSIFGGGSFSVQSRSHIKNYRDLHRLAFGQHVAKRVLKLIRPYLTCKAEQADLAIAFMALPSITSPEVRPNIEAMRDAYAEAIRKAKKRL